MRLARFYSQLCGKLSHSICMRMQRCQQCCALFPGQMDKQHDRGAQLVHIRVNLAGVQAVSNFYRLKNILPHRGGRQKKGAPRPEKNYNTPSTILIRTVVWVTGWATML